MIMMCPHCEEYEVDGDAEFTPGERCKHCGEYDICRRMYQRRVFDCPVGQLIEVANRGFDTRSQQERRQHVSI
jgi:hypothetical protein